MKNFIIGAVIIGLCIIVGFAFFGGKTIIERYGASPGPDHYNQEYFLAGAILGGEVNALGATNTTITAAQFCDSAILTQAVAIDTASTTLPSTTTLHAACLHTDGLHHSVLYRNISNASNSIIVAGSGITLLEPGVTGSDVIIAGGADAIITCIRNLATDTVCIVDEMQDG